MVRLERLAEPCRFDRREPMMDVVQQMQVRAEVLAQRVEQLRHDA